MEDKRYSLINRISLYVTPFCNLRCKHCYIGETTQNQLSINDTYGPIIECISAIGKPVDITGGEPFTLSNIDDIVVDMMSKNISVTGIFTNATLLPQREKQVDRIIEKSPQPISWFVSVDGFGHSHDSFRGNGAFSMTMNGINLLLKKKQVVCINTMLHSKITEQDLTFLHDYIVTNKIKRWRLDSPFMIGSWVNNSDDFELSYNDYVNLLAYVVKLWNESGKCFEIEAGHIFKFLNNNAYFLDNYKEDDPVCPCKTFPIWWNGDVSWCQDLYETDYIIGNVLDTPLDEIYSKYTYYKSRSIRSVASNNLDCKNCDLIEWCGCGCRVYALSFFNCELSKDPIACELYRKKLYEPIMNELINDH